MNTEQTGRSPRSCRPYVATTFSGLKSIDGKRIDFKSWSELRECIEKEPELSNDKHASAFVFASFLPDTDGKLHHKDDLVQEVHALGIDLDDIPTKDVSAALAALRGRGLEFCGYPTHTQLTAPQAGLLRCRLVFPLSAPVAGKKDWDRFWPAAVRYLGLDSIKDPQCKNASRLFYHTCPPGKPGEFAMFCEALSNDGAPLDIAAVFTIAPAPKATPAPKAEPSDTPDLNSARLLGSGVKLERCPKGTSPFQHAEALCKAMPAAVSGSGGHVALLRLARALRWGLELDEAQAVNLISELYNSRCEPEWSDTEIAHKVEHAGAEDGAPYARGALLPPDEPIESPPHTGSPKPSAALLCELSKCHFTDSGNADRFALTFGEDVRYCTPRKKWLRWTGQRWEWDECEQIVELAKRVARAVWEEIHYAPEASDARKSVTKHALYSESRQGLTNMVTLAQSKCALLPSALDSDPWLFNVRNGTLDLRSAELRPHAREDLITKLAPVDFDPSATSELWDRCLEKFTGGDRELSAYLQRALGLALCGQVREKAFWFAYGEPDGGKSTFLNAVAAALGDYHVAADSETWLARHDAGGNRGDLVRLLGARLVTSSEFKPGGRFDVKLMKAITGGDPITAAAKYEGEITFQPAFSLWLAGNDAPTIHDDDEGMWRRVRRVPFTKPIPRSEQDAGMPDKLRTPEVGAAILTWAVAGCLAWQLEGLGSSAAVERSNTDYRAEMDRVAPFFEERCVFELDAKALASELRGAYDMWCRNRGVRSPLGSKEFAKKLREKLCDSKESNGSTVWRGVRVV